jgi:hypothetical protein
LSFTLTVTDSHLKSSTAVQKVTVIHTVVPPPTPSPGANPLDGPSSKGVFLGAMVDPSGHEGVTPQEIDRFVNLAQKGIALCYFSNHWFDSSGPKIKFPTEMANACKQKGIVPDIKMMPWIRETDQTSGNLADAGPFTMTNIIAGMHDQALTQWANEAKAFNYPMLVTFGDEANGNWFPWSVEGPDKFRQAYQHIVTLFRNAGVTNVKWVYSADITFDAKRMHDFYPGDQYVDILSASAYGEDQNPKGAFTALSQHYNEWIATTSDPKKLFGVFEWGLGDANDYQNTLAQIAADRFPKVKFISVWNEACLGPGGQGCPIDHTTQSLIAYRNGIANPIYLGSGLDKALMATAISPPLSLATCNLGQHWDPNLQSCTSNLLPSSRP